jgi:RNA polymerase sigma factor (sigma-70 family)
LTRALSGWRECDFWHSKALDGWGVPDHPLASDQGRQRKIVGSARALIERHAASYDSPFQFAAALRFENSKIPTIFAALIRLHKWMNELLSMISMSDQDSQLSEIIAGQRSRLRSFIRRRVPDPSDAEDVLQDVFYKLVEANRLLMPIDHVTGWLFRVARNRITDLLRKKKPENFSAVAADGADETLRLEDLLPSSDAGPEALYARSLLLDELELALEELPEEQRDVFVAHELEGHSFKEISAQTGVSVNTLLSRKHYAVLHLRKRLQDLYDEFTKA